MREIGESLCWAMRCAWSASYQLTRIPLMRASITERLQSRKGCRIGGTGRAELVKPAKL